MIEFDHIAITVKSLEESIKFYERLGYKLESTFHDEEYRWATLKLGISGLEIFEPMKKEASKISHIAYSYMEDKEAFEFAKNIGYTQEQLEIYYGNLNRKSFFVEDNDGISIQLIKKRK